MTDDLEKLAALLRDDIPAPSSDAKKAAIMAGMQAFAGNSENFQGSPDAARPIHNRPKTGRGLLEGLKDMFKNLSGRQVLLGTASFATIALAVVITQNIDFETRTGPRIGLLEPEVGGILDVQAVVTQDEARVDLGVDNESLLRTELDEVSILAAPEGADANPVASQEHQTSSNDGPSFSGTAVSGYNDTPDSGEKLFSSLTEGDVGDIEATELFYADRSGRIDDTVREDDKNHVMFGDFNLNNYSNNNGPADQSVTNNIIGQLSAVAPAVNEEDSRNPARTREQAVTNGITENGITGQLSAVAPLSDTLSQGFATVADMDTQFYEPEANRDQFAGEAINPLKITLDEPVSTFSIDVDTASYAFARNAILGGYLPNPDAVRTEEMINYFTYDYPVPQPNEAPFTTSITVTDTPWNPDTQLLHIGIQGYELAANERPPVNLVFLIDTSGSMSDPNKLPLLIQSFRLLLSELNDHDSVAIVTYAGSAGMALEPTPATERTKILNSLMRLSSGGSTAGQAGLQQAYALAAEMADDGDTSRVILATDGDFNVGISNTEELKAFIEEKRDTGIYLSILGFGQGNYNDALMQTLAQNGNGTAAYIDTLAEAQKVLVDQIGGALFTIAQDVKIQVEFNPAEVAEYRLIGYETRALAREDFNNDAVDAGDIGAGHSVTALYEITPIGSAALSNDPLRYGTAEALPESNGELAFLKLRYKNPGESTSILITTPVFSDADAGLGAEVDFAAAVAGFGQLLRGDTRLGDWSYGDVVALANTAKADDPFGYRAEFIRLVRLAETAQ